jgi:hypothetical protein
MVTVSLGLATICFLGSCHPALIGENTPSGEFVLQKRIVRSEGYGGDVLQFKETQTSVYAIHRVWLQRPEQRREQRLRSNSSKDRIITSGCINVSPEIYEKLVSCCQGMKLVIQP